MKLASSIVRSESPSRFSNVSAFCFFFRCASSAHLSNAYPGQTSRKCLTVSGLVPHERHLALLILLICLRKAFSGACAVRSCVIRLADLHEMSALLIA